jgi:hypothetical protein
LPDGDQVGIVGLDRILNKVAGLEWADKEAIALELLNFNLNHWLRKEPNERLLSRFVGAEVRAVFTPRCVPVDNAEVVERIAGLGYDPTTPRNTRHPSYASSVKRVF